MKNGARARFFWPRMDADIAEKRNKCATCNGMAPSQPREELLADEPPTFPFKQVAMDYFSLKGHTYVVEACKYSGWIFVKRMEMTAMSEMVTFLRACMDYHGAPKVIESDGGPPFNSEAWGNHLKTWGIQHRLSSAAYAQSNGRAELAVKTAKRILADNTLPSGSLDTDTVTRALLHTRKRRCVVWGSPCPRSSTAGGSRTAFRTHPSRGGEISTRVTRSGWPD